MNAQEPLPGDDFLPVTPANGDVEKVAFPSNEKPIPTYSATFGVGAEVPPPRQMFAKRMMGPRFFNRSASPFETASDMSQVTAPQAALSRSATDGSNTLVHGHHEVSVNRSATKASIGSFDSYYNYSSDSGHGHSDDSTHPMTGASRRWVIE